MVGVMTIIALIVVMLVVAIGFKAIVLAVFLVCPILHHNTDGFDVFGAVSSKIVVCPAVVDAILEAVDDVALRNIGVGCIS